MDQKILHEALLKPEAFPFAPRSVETRETHASRLYFADELVYKVKKPVDFGFLDFTSIEKRRFYCQEEVRLNRRLCPDIYLGVAEIRRSGTKVAIEGPGEVVDYAVVMKRLPEDRLLSNLLATGDPGLLEKMDLLGHRIADFHNNQESFRNQAPQPPHLEVIQKNWQENFSQTAPFVGHTITRRAFEIIRSRVERFLRQNRDLLLRRETEGYIRDGHGDLHCQHICFGESLCIYDCIEFNRRFRIADVLADLAFVLMDLEFRQRPDLATRLLASYSAKEEMQEETDKLLTFYKIYRAWVRGKVESFLSEDPMASDDTRREAAAKAARYFNLALGYLCPPVLIATCGLMGTGKTTIASALCHSLRGKLIRSDILRKEIAGMDSGERCAEKFHQGIYRPDFSDRTYDLLLNRALAATHNGQSVIADAAFGQRRRREAFRQAADMHQLPFLFLHVTCDRETALARLDRRQALARDASDGRRELFDRQAETFETPSAEDYIFQIDSLVPLNEIVAEVLCNLLGKFGCRL
jgi:aminoglycoside phosphotransferase family enzyme/predicted kinase